MFRDCVGITLIILGVIAGCWVGFWWAFVGGIVDIIEVIRADELVAFAVARGVAKILFAGSLGLLTALAFILPGRILIRRPRR